MEQSTQHMTSEDLYKVLTNKYRERYLNFTIEDIRRLDRSEPDMNTKLETLVSEREQIRSAITKANSYVIPEVTFQIRGEIENSFSADVEEFGRKKSEVLNQIERMKETSRAEYDNRCIELQKKSKASIAPLQKKHEELMQYKDKLKGVMERYGITPGDIEIDQGISAKEFEDLLDVSLDTCRKFDKSYEGVIGKIESQLDDEPLVVYAIVGAASLVTWLVLPIIGIAYIGVMIKNTSTLYTNRDKLRVAENIMHTTEFDKFIPESEKYVQPEYDDSEVTEEANKMLKELEEQDPSAILSEELRKLGTDAAMMYNASALEEMRETPKKELRKVKEHLASIEKSLTHKIEEEMKAVKKLGEYSNPSAVMDTAWVMGYKNGVIPYKVDYGLSNINIVGEYGDTILQTLKVMMVNMLSNVRANMLTITVLDIEYLGQSVSEFCVPETSPYIKINSKQFSEVQEDMQKKASENIMAIKKGTILDFNRNAEEQGMVTKPYYLYILLTGLGDKLTENKPFMEFIKYSAQQGVFVWTVYKEELEGVNNIRVPLSVPPDVTPIFYDYELGSNTLDSFRYALKNNKTKALDYRNGYLYKYLPEDQWWKKNSIKGLNIRPGLVEGDPSKAWNLLFDDKNVHFLMGGATGAGKSVAIDCMMQSLVHEYAPDELQLVYIDMKNSEVAKYTKNGYSLIPHAIIVSGTEDGEYCLSIMDWALDEYRRRMSICSRYKVQKVEDLRKKFDDPTRPDYNPEVHIPRTVILIDEFQVMFDTSRIPAKVVDLIGARLTSLAKLARAASIHLWFTSQDMGGTLKKQTLENFSTRGALRCSASVSEQLLGNPASSTIREKVGWMYSNDSAGTDKNANKIWRVPYAPGDDLILGMTELMEKAKKEGKPILNARFYDEKEGVTKQTMEEEYVKEPRFKDCRQFALGSRTMYSEKPTPVNFKILEDDKENIFVTASERQDTMDLIGTLIDNILMSEGDCSLLINSADKDTIFLLDLDKYMPEGWEDFLSTRYETADVLADLSDLADAREETHSDSTLYVMLLMWEKKSGIGQDENFKQQDALVNVIRRLNNVGVHFIFVSRDKGVPRSVMNLCNHKICAKCSEQLAVQVVDDPTPYKFPAPDGDKATFAVYKYGSETQKFKIYRHKLEKELEVREL